MVLRFVDKEVRGVYAEIRGSLESVQKAAAPWTKDVFFAADLKLVKHRYFAGHFLDLSEKGSKAKAHPVAQGHPQAMEMQKVFPIARSDFQVMEQQCQGREHADIVGVVTQLDLPPTSKPKANLWLKDLPGGRARKRGCRTAWTPSCESVGMQPACLGHLLQFCLTL